MRISIIGQSMSGKSTVFRALTGAQEGTPGGDVETTVRAVRVPDERVDAATRIYSPKKTSYANVEYVDLGAAARTKEAEGELGTAFLNAVRPATALLHVIDGFSNPDDIAGSVAEAVDAIDTELVLSDLGVCEKRLTRLRKQAAKAGPEVEERRQLEKAVEMLSEGRPLRTEQELSAHPALRNFTLLSSKPIVTVVNTDEDNASWDTSKLSEEVRNAREGEWGEIIALCGQLEAEIAALPPEEAAAFLSDYGIESPARERVIRVSYELLGLMPFYTVGPDEVRAWTIRKGASAQEAAGAIHTDIARGFIRAEVLGYDTMMEAGSFEDAKKKGKVRLEGKSYVMQDGDIVSFRFNV